MVTETKEVFWTCDHCGLSFDTREEAVICEKIHEDGLFKKIYIHGYNSVKELMENYELDEDDAELVQTMFSEIEFLIKIKDNTTEIVGIDGCFIDKDKLYKPSEYK